ncbi:Rmf/CrpP fold protein [Streptomyces smyrnaeus]|uniref:Rmf/CrpP fold protein n=1 Tax=Streptomyces smyrnaeus TaxID=1387713 RepID=UPI0033B1DA2A
MATAAAAQGAKGLLSDRAAIDEVLAPAPPPDDWGWLALDDAPSTDRASRARDRRRPAGQQARREQRPVTMCPYPVGDLRRSAWVRGYTAGWRLNTQ